MTRRNTTARQKAAKYAAAFTQREEKFQGLATEFFDLEDKSEHGKLQKRIQDYQQKLEELQANSAAAEAELRAQQAPIIYAMKQAGETPANIAKRLDISRAVVKQALRTEKEKQATVGEIESVASEGTHHELAEISIHSNDEERNESNE